MYSRTDNSMTNERRLVKKLNKIDILNPRQNSFGPDKRTRKNSIFISKIKAKNFNALSLFLNFFLSSFRFWLFSFREINNKQIGPTLNDDFKSIKKLN